MMSEPKGRGGKKPKYQIADIGGADLTSEDISTERVLNFLIKGERVDEQVGAPGSEGDESSSSTTAARSALLTEESGAPEPPLQERPVKKSLNHLFERAGSGTSGPAKDLKLNLLESESETAPSPALPIEQQVVTSEALREAERVGDSSRTEAAAPSEAQKIESHGEIPPESLSQPMTGSVAASTPPVASVIEPLEAKAVEQSPELAHYVELWKNFYRLKAGEIEALSTMFRMSHDEGRSECYVKMRKLAEMSNLDYRYCQKVVRSLERLGWITKLQDYDATTQLGVLYRVNLKPSQLL
ncbi:MAG TPA: hypothetical protein VGC66_21080 [Pyrinomonadaceae bacterium]|jgi:hypothetical protein